MFLKKIYSVFLLHLITICSLGMMTSCITETLDPCGPVALRVITGPLSKQDEIADKDVQKARIYVFDENLLLLEIRDTELYKKEYLDYVNKKLHVVAIANALDREVTLEPKQNESKQKGMISLLPGESYYNLKPFLTTDDLMWGEMDLNTAHDSFDEKVYDLPIRRITAGILVRVYGLDAYARKQGWKGPFHVVFESPYEKTDFYGKSHTPTTGYIHYDPLTQRGDVGYYDLYECPGKGFGKQYANVLASDNPSRINVHLYSGSERIYSTEDGTGHEGELNIENGRMHLVNIIFGGAAEGYISVTIEQPTWTIIPLPIINFD